MDAIFQAVQQTSACVVFLCYSPQTKTVIILKTNTMVMQHTSLPSNNASKCQGQSKYSDISSLCQQPGFPYPLSFYKDLLAYPHYDS